MYYFISDTHFYHKRVIEFEQRPFKSLEHMHEELIKRWNQRVKEDDTVIIVGDFNFGGVSQRNKLFKILKGHKVLIKGNHDASSLLLGGYVELGNGKGWEIVHNPLDSSASRVIHGHIHLPTAQRVVRHNERLFVNVNCELWDYTPVSVKQIMKELRKSLEE